MFGVKPDSHPLVNARAIGVGETTYDVYWKVEPGDGKDDGEVAFGRKMVFLLTMHDTVGKKRLTFFGRTKDVCLDHLDRYLEEA